MTELLSKQALLQRSIERALDNFKKVGRANLTPAKIRSRLASLQDSWNQYQDVHVRLLQIVSDKDQATTDYFKDNFFEATEDIYQNTRDAFTDSLEELEPVVSPKSSSHSTSIQADQSGISSSSMPPIRLPPFNGSYSDWENFRDRFSALVIQNKSIGDFARMHYLASSVTGPAFNCISDIPVTADKFQLAWATLSKRYDNKQRLMHFTTLFGLSALQRESALELQTLVDKVQIAVSSLRVLDRSPSDLWSDVLVHLVTQKLDPGSRKAWNLKVSDADSPPTYDELNNFLTTRCRALDDNVISSTSKANCVSKASRAHNVTTSGSASACPLCKARHYLSACPKFTVLTPKLRLETVKKFKRCLNCMSASHAVQDCKSQYSCRSCQKRHHSMLHMESDALLNSSAIESSASASPPAAPDRINALSASAIIRDRPQVLLATARVTVGVSSGRSVVVRALLDQGSEATFISEALAQTLRAKRTRMPVAISAVGGVQIGHVRQALTVSVSPSLRDAPSFTTMALILKSLTSYTPTCVSLPSLSHLSHLTWADPDPTSSEPIHMIIGADLYGDLILNGIKKGTSGQPIAQNTVLGWVISGPIVATASVPHVPVHLTVHHCTPSHDLETALCKFWEIEELPMSRVLAPQEKYCEEHFCSTHSRDSTGRYTVRLPFRVPTPLPIGQSRSIAEIQFNRLTRRFHSHMTLRSEYSQFMCEYEQLNHMRRAPEAPLSNQQVYIPHHPVFKADSVTTRLRVVFNASSSTSNGTSLNDLLHSGPKLQTDLPAIILQWRQFQFVYTADIAKMYRQILVDERDINYQRILWQPEPSGSVYDYQLLTVTYGMSCAPYLALRVLRRLAEDDGPNFPLAIPIILKQTYVDDVLFGAHDIQTLKQKRDDLVSLLRCGHFELRKWASNSDDLLEDIDPSDHGLACDKSISNDETVKILGIVWRPALDAFCYRVSLEGTLPQTKRSILSVIARLYDPLGWATPVIVAAKILMQRLWRLQLDWDSPPPSEILVHWESIYSQLIHLNNVRIERWIGVHSDYHVELHGFADASTVAYAASVYVRVTRSDGTINVSLLAGKSKVAPIKPLTIPRLELMAALLLSRLFLFVRTTLDLTTVACRCWTDSAITLTWLRSHPSRWTTFVANRVCQIQELLPDVTWHHVPTQDNPADCASRGILGGEYLLHPTWWHGPPWLSRAPESWPSEFEPSNVEVHEEKKVISIHVAEAVSRWNLADKYSSWGKLVRVTAYILRFITHCRCKGKRSTDTPISHVALSCPEISCASLFWIRYIQRDLFQSELRSLQTSRTIAPKSCLSTLNPFLDPDEIIRVGGRLRHSSLPYDNKHPIILAPHRLVRLLVVQAHLQTLHGGHQLTLSRLRQEYWIIRARNIVKSVVFSCVVCVRERAATPTQLMGNLPTARVSRPPRAFSWCGLDYAGPVKVRASAGRGITSRKAYIALFICLSTRAIHLELVGDYTSSAFRGAFTRFCSRRGLPQAVYSDNGTTFVGADKELTTAYLAALRDPNFLNQTATDRITWHFIPPSSPHFGGLWEAGVRSMKHHLRRVIGNHTLTIEEFTTLLCQIEACLNSRPIAPLSDAFDDYQHLTPGHFLIGSAITKPPEPSVLMIPENRLSRWLTVRQLSERFWHLWSSDYINTLQQRTKWRQTTHPIEVGRLVFLRNPNLPPCKWELGRVTQIHPGADGLTRVVTIKTATSTYVRPIGKLCVLSINCESSQT